MKIYLLFLFWGLFFIIPAEFIIQTIIVPNGSILGTCIIYSVLLSIYYLFRKQSFLRSESRIERILESFILGSFGLFIMEWMIIGNSPWDNPGAIQSSMFIWWIWVFLFPKVMISEKYITLRKPLIIYQVIYSIIFYGFMYLIGEPIAFIFPYAYGLWGFYYFSYRYIWSK